MKPKPIKKKDGFTIVEVMIVIAIAGLILLIVFLAVPALQRNSRNTERKRDASAMMAAVSEYRNNNRNEVPDSCAGNQEDCFVKDVKTSYYDVNSNNVRFLKLGSSGLIGIINNFFGSNTDNLTIANYAKCGDDNRATADGASSKSLVALYAVETSGEPDPQCLEG